ncbi:hypothetical protein [Jiella mangrovi]|uniref:DNA-binding protein n=1 Tax=Jiella mangrovi TaxID=2821407 RepID=A0ABS4BQ03_9HYPH|nr:hypothetical protein [Jiella mangrovi]MBP0618306.1 hypothetical protein [Jiella mangrovi]
MSLSEAADLLGLKPNSVRSRYKAGHIRGERDNQGKIWVWIDPEDEPSKSPSSKVSRSDKLKAASKPFIEAFEAMTAHIETLKGELAAARSELDELRPKASRSDVLAAELESAKKLIEAHRAFADEVSHSRDEYRQQASETLQRLIELTEVANERRGLLSWLLPSKKSRAS